MRNTTKEEIEEKKLILKYIIINSFVLLSILIVLTVVGIIYC